MFEQSQITQLKVTLLGAKKFKGDIEGNFVDTCTVLVATPMPSQSGNAVGFTASSMKFGDSENYKRVENLRYPVLVIATIEMTSTGKGMNAQLKDFQLEQPAAQKG